MALWNRRKLPERVFSSTVLVLLSIAACGRGPEPPRNVILVTIDTLRADRIGVYGASDVETPNLDRMAQEGAMAERATAHVPLTRPSHASLFTGMLPTTHGIRDNISPASLPEVPTLASVLKSAGFRTAAFVSSVVLASGAGMERGFDLYVDDFGEESEATEGALFLNTLQRPGDETIEAATSWLEANREGPFFAWIHLYDPHEPYEPPEPYRSRYAERPYDGEVAWSDELVGRLDRTLEELGLRETTLLVVTSDHGEGLGEHRETLHGFFIYETTLSIPLLFRGPGIVPGTRLPRLARTIDLFPTILDLMGIPVPEEAEIRGESLASVLRGGPAGREPISYAESLVPLLHFGWSDLRSIRRGNWKYIQAPRPELYDLDADPMEISNLAESRPDLVRGMMGALGEELDRERAAAVSTARLASVPQELLDRLGALGYVGSSAPVATSSPGADPKDKIEEFRVANALIRDGIRLFHEGKYAESVDAYRKLLAIPVDSFEAHFYLARGLAVLMRHGEAVPHFQRAVEILPTSGDAWEGLAQSLSATGDFPAALETVRKAQTALPEHAGLRQREGALLLRLGKHGEAQAAYEKAVELAPDDALLRARYGELLRDLGDIEGSIRTLREATALDPDEAAYWNSLGMTLGGNGRLKEGEDAFRRAVELEKDNARYAFNLGLVLMRQNRPAEARPFFEEALRIEPRFQEARRFLAEIGER